MASTNSDHFALVIGIDSYAAGVASLKGACSDATHFYDWLAEDQGGSLPLQNIAFLTNPPQAASANPPRHASEQPTYTSVRTAISNWTSVTQLTRQPIGKRLYIFLAGHGYNDAARLSDVHLLVHVYNDMMADGFPGTAMGSWFQLRAMFDEILLIMDCCRDREVSLAVDPIPAPPVAGVPGKDAGLVKILFSYATQWGKKSREREINSVMQGVFTAALLEGLRGAACDPQTGEVSCVSLIRYLNVRVPLLHADAKGTQRPAFTPALPSPAEDFVICSTKDGATFSMAPHLPLLRIALGPAHTAIRIWPGAYDPLAPGTALPIDWIRTGTEWHCRLPLGVYVIEWLNGDASSSMRPIIFRGDSHESP